MTQTAVEICQDSVGVTRGGRKRDISIKDVPSRVGFKEYSHFAKDNTTGKKEQGLISKTLESLRHNDGTRTGSSE